MLRLGGSISGSKEILFDGKRTVDNEDEQSALTDDVGNDSADSSEIELPRLNVDNSKPSADMSAVAARPGRTPDVGASAAAANRKSNAPAEVRSVYPPPSTSNGHVSTRPPAAAAYQSRPASGSVPTASGRRPTEPSTRPPGASNHRRSNVAVTQSVIDRTERNAENDLRSLVGPTTRNVVYFVLLYAVVICFRSAVSSYIDGIMETLRRKYALGTSELQMIDGAEMIGLVLSLAAVAAFSRRSHKPLMIVVGVTLCAVGTLTCAVPYFVESGRGGTPFGNVSSPSRNSTDALPDRAEYLLTEMCQSRYAEPPRPGDLPAVWYQEPCSALNSTVSATYGPMAYSIVCTGTFVFGLGSGLFVTAGFVYIDEIAMNKLVPIHFGVVLTMNGFGRFIGACFAWWFTSYSENLSSDSNELPWWEYRAWWLGLVVLSGILLLTGWLFIFYPKWIVEPVWITAARERHLRRLRGLLEFQKQERRRRRDLRKKADQWHRQQQNAALVDPNTVPSVNYGTVADQSSTNMLSVNGLQGPADERPEDFDNWESFPDDEVSGYQNGVVVPDEDSRNSVSYWNPMCNILDESEPTSVFEGSVASNGAAIPPASNGAADGRPTRPGRGVTFNEDEIAADAQDAASRAPPVNIVAVVSNKRKRHVLEKKFDDIRDLIVGVPSFSVSVLAASLAAYLQAGYRSNAAQFVRAQYNYDYDHSWFYTIGLCCGLAQTVGPLLGGIIVHKMRLSQHQQLKMIISLLAVTAALFLLLFAVGCSDATNSWQDAHISKADVGSGVSVKWVTSCDDRCRCGVDGVNAQLEPVCLSNGRRYFSPCHAGCTKLRRTNTSLVFYSCTCGNATYTDAPIESVECSSDCPVYGAYWFILFFAVVFHTMTQVSILLQFLRIVAEKKRSMSLGIAVWLIIVIAFVPGTGIYSAFQKSQCRDEMTFTDCHGLSVCWLYNVDDYRYLIHGVTAAFQVAAILLFVVVLLLTPSAAGASWPNRRLSSPAVTQPSPQRAAGAGADTASTAADRSQRNSASGTGDERRAIVGNENRRSDDSVTYGVGTHM